MVSILALNNPFYTAYISADFLGKGIFALLFAVSVVTWIVLIYKVWLTAQARQDARRFRKSFEAQRANPLGVEWENMARRGIPNPFLSLYQVLKRHSLEILNKNRRFGGKQQGEGSFLSRTDIDVVEAHLMTTVASETKHLESNLYILSTVVSLAPFLGLLGTVWGILIFFSEMQAQHVANTNQAVLGGISLALTTTVLGLINAIPALIGYNYLRSVVGDFSTEMEGFSNEILASVEMQYRKVDLN